MYLGNLKNLLSNDQELIYAKSFVIKDETYEVFVKPESQFNAIKLTVSGNNYH